MTEPFTILLVEPIASRRFSLPGCEFVAVASGAAALLCTLERRVHLILLQVEMPEMDGFETARHLQMTERTRDIPVVFIAPAFPAASFSRHGYALGIVDCLVMPLDPQLVFSRIHLYRRLYECQGRLDAVLETQRQNEISLAQAREQAETANRAKSAFLAKMSLEICTPMNAIISYACTLGGSSDLSPVQRGHVATIRSSGDHLRGIINDILELSKVGSCCCDLHCAVFDLHDLITSVLQMCSLRAEAKNLDISLQVAAAVPRLIHADPEKVRQVLINLLGNALKFTSAGAVDLEVSACPAEPGWLISIIVKDTGPGIDPAEHESIFAPFAQAAKRPDGVEGTGLGLAIARKHARLMSGDITCTSRLGFGAAFHFSFRAGLSVKHLPGDLPS
jgi:two-component system, sensor histidine kinase and response regulator